MVAEIAKVGSRERGLLEAEMKLYMTTPTTPPSSPNVYVATTHGSNSPVNVGSGSVNQQINSAEGMAELVTALGALLEAMAQGPDQQELSEVREVLVEARDEAAKSQPNRLKLRFMLAGAKDAVQTLSVSPAAWEAVHRIGQALGVL
jgi:hypothetical protein